MLRRILIANRGEVAIRIARAAAELAVKTVSVHSQDDANGLHLRRSDTSVKLRGMGASAYLDIDQLLAAARESGCDAIHPGYGFLSENSLFARKCAAAGLIFIGPSPETLEILGDKVQARQLAERLRVPIPIGTSGPTTLDAAEEFFATLPPGAALVIKAMVGGGGRGIRIADTIDSIRETFPRCRSEAEAAFGNGALYVEQAMKRARHVEVQIVGDGTGSVVDLGERECSIQRRGQKLIEVAPSPGLDPAIRRELVGAARRMAEELSYRGVGTFEFLVDTQRDTSQPFVFIEANARLQVEHTVTEQVMSVDLVKMQILLASGGTIADCGFIENQPPEPRGFAIQLRINTESMTADGGTLPCTGTLVAFDPPSGPGIRVDTAGYGGYRINSHFDPLLAKLIAWSPSSEFADAVTKSRRALAEFRIEGVSTNIGLLDAVLAHPAFLANEVHTRFVEQNADALVVAAQRTGKPDLFFPATEGAIDGGAADHAAPPANSVPVTMTMQGSIVSIDVDFGARVHGGQQLAVIESMKMEFVVKAEISGTVVLVAAKKRDVVNAGQAIMYLEASDVDVPIEVAEVAIDLGRISPQLAEVEDRHRLTRDEARPEAVARRRKTGLRTARENIDDLCDPGSFKEYGPLVLAAQRSRRSTEELIAMSPADGLVTGVGTVNGAFFAADRTRCIVMSYDYAVFAGTQGVFGHKKKDRMFDLAEQARLPVILFAEGGGGRPGEFDQGGVAAFENKTFMRFGRLSGLVPLVGIGAGRCFAGNAALLGCCDVVIATKDSSIGMAGPAMIEGGGLGAVRPETVGPIGVQASNGVVDVIAEDEAEAVCMAKKYIGYFQGDCTDWQVADQRALRSAIPENRLRAYNVHAVIETLADTGSVLELRPKFAPAMVTAFVRVEGRPLGLIANNSVHLGGAIDAAASDKAARFMQCCDAFDIPILSLVDTPGFMVGPEAEKTALVRHVARMYVVGANVSVPFFTVVLRKAYGLGAIAMAGGSFHNPVFTVSWPTGEFGPMGLEGSVRLAYRRELEAIIDLDEREAEFQRRVAGLYENGKAINAATYFELDDVIDPVETRAWISLGLSATRNKGRAEKKRKNIDTW
jgi:acetyl/propionyl-CoA carboxylase alpha subunit/acetyl-CoA carboxylase carboxyltransferase component